MVFGEGGFYGAVAPGVEFLGDPCRESNGRVGESVAQGLRFAALNGLVARFFFHKFLGMFETINVVVAEGGGIRLVLGGACENHVEVDAADVVGIEVGGPSGCGRAPVAALNAVVVVAEFGHECDVDFGDFGDVEAGIFGRI